MMDTMRSFASGIVAKLLLLFLVITFGVWGVGDILRNSGTTYAAKVGDETITVGEFERQKNVVARQMQAIGMANVNMSALNGSVLRQLIQQRLVGMAMQDLGLYVNKALLADVVRHEPVFQNPDGSFNKQAFQAVLQNHRISEGELLRQMKDETGGKFLLASLDMSDVMPPAPVRNLVAAAALETRDAWIVTIAPVSAPATIADADLNAFYERNKSVLYMQPETRDLQYVTLKPAQIDALVDQSITADMEKEAVASQPKASKSEIKERLRSEQRDHVLHDLQGTIEDALASGVSLGDALKKSGINSPPHELKNLTEAQAKASTDDVTKTAASQGFTMGEGETSGLIVSAHGAPMIVHVDAVKAAAPQEFKAVEADVRARVGEQQRRDAVRSRMQEVKEALTKLASDDKQGTTDKQWQDVLARFHLTARRETNLSRPANEKTAQDGIPASLAQAIFEHEVGTVAGPLTLDSGGQMLAIITATHHPSSAPVKGSAANQKAEKELSDALNQSVQMRAFTSFSERHRVKINEQVLSSGAAQAADADQ